MDNNNSQKDIDKIDDIAMATADGLNDDEGLYAAYFRELQQDLGKEMQQSEKRLPKCYESGTFWITPPGVFFTLWNKGNNATPAVIATRTTNTTKTESSDDPNNSNSDSQLQQPQQPQQLADQLLRRPRVFVWLVHLLVESLECPDPKCNGSKLQSHGWPTGPCARRIVDLSSDFYLMSYRYKCSHCKRTYFGHDEAIRDTLPLVLQEEFPAILSHRSGISRSTMELLQSCSDSSVGIDPFAKLLKEHRALRHARVKRQCLAAKEHPPSAPAPKPSAPRKRRHSSSVNNANYAGPSSSSTPFRPSHPPTIAPRPPQPTPVFLPHPMLAVQPPPPPSAATAASKGPPPPPIISVTTPSGTTTTSTSPTPSSSSSSSSSVSQAQPTTAAVSSASLSGKQLTPIQPAPIQAAPPFPFFAIPPGGAIFYPAQQGMPIPLQPVFILPDPRTQQTQQQQPLLQQQQQLPQQQPSFHVPKKPRKPRTILKKPA